MLWSPPKVVNLAQRILIACRNCSIISYITRFVHVSESSFVTPGACCRMKYSSINIPCAYMYELVNNFNITELYIIVPFARANRCTQHSNIRL